MIRFSKMADYGVLLLGHFVRHEGVQASASELAETFHMPRTLVANLLKSFREAGLLESRRGLKGGYLLARPADEISLLDVLGVIDGPVRLTDCALLEADLETEACDYEDVCTSRSPMLKVHRQIMELLSGITLGELIENGSPTTLPH